MLTDEAHERPWGIYSGYFRDPDGHLGDHLDPPPAAAAVTGRLNGHDAFSLTRAAGDTIAQGSFGNTGAGDLHYPPLPAWADLRGSRSA
jgi:hypothetical protein